MNWLLTLPFHFSANICNRSTKIWSKRIFMKWRPEGVDGGRGEVPEGVRVEAPQDGLEVEDLQDHAAVLWSRFYELDMFVTYGQILEYKLIVRQKIQYFCP
jgi:hypothetical protein